MDSEWHGKLDSIHHSQSQTLAIINTFGVESINPLRPNNDASQTSHCNIRGLSVSEVMRIENMITQVQLY